MDEKKKFESTSFRLPVDAKELLRIAVARRKTNASAVVIAGIRSFLAADAAGSKAVAQYLGTAIAEINQQIPHAEPGETQDGGDGIRIVKQASSDPVSIVHRIVNSRNLRVIDATTTCLSALERLVDDDAKDSVDQAKGPARPGVPGARIDALRGTVGGIERTIGSKAGTISPQKAGKKRHKRDSGRSE